MKTKRPGPPSILLAAALLPFVFSACATPDGTAAANAAAAAKAADLVIAVNVPPTWRPFLADDIAETFSDRVEDVFKNRGYTGRIAEQDDLTAPRSGQALLTIYLDEWKVDHVGNVVCTFRATLQTGAESPHGLGYFRSTQMRMMRGLGRWGLADSFGNAADDAIHNLYRKLTDAHLLSGAPSKDEEP
jgi:hypothetical protein